MIINWFCNSDIKITKFSPPINSYQIFLELAIGKVHALALETKGQAQANEKILAELRLVGASSGFSAEYRYWVLTCGLFSPERNIVKHWKEHEKAFLELIRQDGKIGIKHCLQAIILFFVRKNPEQLRFAPTFMKLVVCDQQFFQEEFIIKWHGRKAKLDKSCALYDRKAEKAFRGAIEQFVTWLQ
jgi:hypothetical protein